MENFWDQRYSEPGFAYGNEPNDFFREITDSMPPGKLLLPGEGEGRNAIYAAHAGWDVTAIDQSRVARDKALEWATSLELKIDYQLADLTEFECRKPEFDLIALVYIHMPEMIRFAVHKQLSACVKPGGLLIMECFHKTQLQFGTGGPPVEELLYNEQDLRKDFAGMEIQQCENLVLYKEEGKYHEGESSVIRLIAKKQTQ
jgi:SAM-dependent methyltransferase